MGVKFNSVSYIDLIWLRRCGDCVISGDLYWPTTDKPPEVVMKSEARKEAEKLGANAIGKQSHMT